MVKVNGTAPAALTIGPKSAPNPVVLAPMSGVTDNLLKLSKAVSDKPTDRELDVLLVRRADEAAVFEAMATAEGLDRPGRGLLFTTPVERLAAFGSQSAQDRGEGP